MACKQCSNKLVIRTDPENCDYILHEGLKRIRANAIETIEKDETKGAFGQLEKQKIDVEVALALKPKLEQIIERN